MKTQRQTLHVAKHARTVPVHGPTGVLRTDPLVRAARGILIMAVVLGSLGTEAVAVSGTATVDHASGHHSAGTIRLAAKTSGARSPWMY
jgi:hypothetical protein